MKHCSALAVDHFSKCNLVLVKGRICDALRDLVPFVQFKKREKHPWRSVNFSKVAGFEHATLLKLTLLRGCFPRFLNCTNGTKSRNAPHMIETGSGLVHLGDSITGQV